MLLRLWVQNEYGLFPLNQCTREELTMLNEECMMRYRRPALFMARSVEAVKCLMEVGGLSLRESTLFLHNWTAFNMFLYMEEFYPAFTQLTDYVLSFATTEDLMRLDSLGRNALFQATTLDRVQWIVERVEDDSTRETMLNTMDDTGKTLLMKHVDHPVLSEWLMDRGVELNHQDKDGCTFLTYLVEEYLIETGKTSLNTLRKALSYGADPDLENNKGVSVSSQIKSILWSEKGR